MKFNNQKKIANLFLLKQHINMTKSQQQKLILVYSTAAIFMICCFYQEKLLSLLSAGFILGFMANETFFTESKYDEK